jgi:hypothetical protein
MVVDHDSWPAAGRLGRVTKGSARGCWVLVTAEIKDYWIVYLTDPESLDDHDRNADFHVEGNADMQHVV